jgi:tripartite-type tricarboxylate transporter receptor subunit TctC
MHSTRRVLTLALLSGALVPTFCPVAGSASAQTFPTKAVHIVVPFAAGGALDSVTRTIAEQLQAKWGHPVIVENRAGASGNVGANYVAHTEPDGHTLMASPPPPMAVNQFLFKSLTFKPSEFTTVAILATAPNVLLARSGIPASSLPDLIALAKAKPGKLSYASTGRGGTPHLTMEWLKLEAGIELAHVPYPKGFAPALTDLIGGHVDFIFANLADARNLINDGQAKALGVASDSPTGDLKGVAPISRNIPDFVSLTWFALAAPPRTPDAVAQKIASDVRAAVAAPSVASRLGTLSLTPVVKSPAEASLFVKEETARWQRVIKLIGLEPE